MMRGVGGVRKSKHQSWLAKGLGLLCWGSLRKVKHRSHSYSPVKERKKHNYSKKYDYPKFQYRQTSDNQKKTPSAYYRCGKLHWAKDCPYHTKKCQNCDKFGHKGSQCRNRKIIKNRVRHTKSEDESDIQKARTSQTYKKRGQVRHTKSEDESDKIIRKYITVKVLNKLVRFQLNSGSDLSIINLQTWRKLNKPIIKMTSKTAQMVTGDKIKFEGEIIIPVSLNGFRNWINQLIRFAKK